MYHRHGGVGSIAIRRVMRHLLIIHALNYEMRLAYVLKRKGELTEQCMIMSDEHFKLHLSFSSWRAVCWWPFLTTRVRCALQLAVKKMIGLDTPDRKSVV